MASCVFVYPLPYSLLLLTPISPVLSPISSFVALKVTTVTLRNEQSKARRKNPNPPFPQEKDPEHYMSEELLYTGGTPTWDLLVLSGHEPYGVNGTLASNLPGLELAWLCLEQSVGQLYEYRAECWPRYSG